MHDPSESSEPGTVQTRRSLVSRLRNLDDRESWQDFFETYWKLIYSVARRAGLSEAEAEEVVQETTVAVSKYILEYRYDPQRCSFKTWLLQKTRWKIIDQVRKRPPGFVQHLSVEKDPARTGTVERIPDPNGCDLEAVWENEWQQNLFEAAIERLKGRLKPEHYQIYFLSTVRKLGPGKVARVMGVNIARVYMVRHRVGALLKKEIRALQTARP